MSVPVPLMTVMKILNVKTQKAPILAPVSLAIVEMDSTVQVLVYAGLLNYRTSCP